MTNVDEIKRKLRAILAKTDDGSGATEAEVANALAFARRLMVQHNISTEELGRPRNEHELAADAEAVEYGRACAWTQGQRLSAWESTLSAAIERLVGTVGRYRSSVRPARRDGRALFSETGAPRRAVPIYFYGPVADARDATELFEEWALTISALGRMRYGNVYRGEGRSYCEGFAAALRDRVTRLQREERTRIEASQRGSLHPAEKALVVQTADALGLMAAKREQAEAWLSRQGVELGRRGRSAGGEHHSGAYAAGKTDGQNARFSRQRQARIEG